MKKLILSSIIIALLTSSARLFGQTGSISTVVDQPYPGMNAKQVDSIKQAAYNFIFSNPDLLNDAFAKYVGALKTANGKTYDFMRDLNIKFKTFQADNQSPALGFEYKYENSWSKVSHTPKHSFNQSYNLNFNGNVAFKKVYNPADFLESKAFYNGTFIWGGIAKKNTPEQKRKLDTINRLIETALAASDFERVKALYEQSDELTKITDQYLLGVSLNASYESNQDFSKRQFVPGVLINAGAKAWDKNEALRYFNLPDYPFALIRMLTGTDSDFNLSGASFPSALFGLDYVTPEQDSLRKAVTGALDPFFRLRFEAAFKTKAAAVGKQIIYFSADYRWYKELNASDAIKNAQIDHFNYFVATLESNNGFFVNYTTGKLPFDKKSSNVYGIGFHYDLGNWK
ncbi:MAG: hypothetical protein ACTHMI_19255 [Mucilaginibacter sp.]